MQAAGSSDLHTEELVRDAQELREWSVSAELCGRVIVEGGKKEEKYNCSTVVSVIVDGGGVSSPPPWLF